MTTKSAEHKPNTIRGTGDRNLQLQDFDVPERKRAPRVSKTNLRFAHNSAWRDYFLPSESPSAAPSLSIEPSASPSVSPSESIEPSEYPSAFPTVSPSNVPSAIPSASPSTSPTQEPSSTPSVSMEPSGVPSEAPSPSPTLTPIKIACMGDSMTRGVTGMWNNPGFDYPTQLEKLLGNPYETYNFGRNSVTAMRGMPGSYTSTSTYQNAIDMKADIYLIMLGTNDSKYWVEAAHKFPLGLEWIIQQAKHSPETRVILGIPPWVKRDSIGISDDILLNNVRPRILEVAAAHELRVVDMYEVTVNRYEYYTNDDLHLNARGYEAVAQAWEKEILCDYGKVCYGKKCNYVCRNDVK